MADYDRIIKNKSPAVFEDPKTLWFEACRYFEHVDANPITRTTEKKQVKQAVAKGGEVVDLKDHTKTTTTTERPYSIFGLVDFIGVTYNSWVAHCNKVAKDDSDKGQEFARVIEFINGKINAQQLEGNISGLFK